MAGPKEDDRGIAWPVGGVGAQGPVQQITPVITDHPYHTLKTDSKLRKQYPLASGLFDYFPDALVAVAHVSWNGNNQHNPGEPLHWARGKSDDHADTMQRHFVERGQRDADGQWHAAKMAWRALAILQLLIEKEEGAPLPPGAK